MKSAIFMAAVVSALSLWGAEQFPTLSRLREYVIAERTLKPTDDLSVDRSSVLQRTLNEVGRNGGGTVFLRSGSYVLRQPIVVPVGVTLRGEYSGSTFHSDPCTVLRLYAGRGDENGQAAVTVNPGAGLVGLVFHYPEQSLENPTPYPWTISTAANPPVANDNQTVRCCALVNSWRGIKIGPEWNELHLLRDLRICALKTGISLDFVTDIGRMDRISLGPKNWLDFKNLLLDYCPKEDELGKWMREHDTVGVDVGRSDWEFIRSLRVSNYRTGMRFRRSPKGLTNAVLANAFFTDCVVALDLDELNEVGLAVCVVEFNSKNGGDIPIRLGSKLKSDIQLHGVTVQDMEMIADPRIRICNSDPELVRIIKSRYDGMGLTMMAFNATPEYGLYDVTDYGASSQLEDNAPAFRKAFEAAKKGGTVYVPAGRYRFRGNIHVPSGVELRGCSEVPHHTCSGGSVLMPYQGRNDENGEPFITLAPKSGVRGLAVWYPEQTTIAPVPYPWTVRALGARCWVRDVNIGNGWQGVDFATHKTDRHFISYLSGCCWRRALAVAGAEGGCVEDLQFNPHYSLRRAPGLPVAKNPPPPVGKVPNAGWEAGELRNRLEGFVFTDCTNQWIEGTFLYAAKEGLVFKGANQAQVLIHGTDTGARGVVLDQKSGSKVDVFLAQLVPWEVPGTGDNAGIWTAPTDRGEAVFQASQFWAGPKTMIQRGSGTLTLDSLNSLSGPMAVYAGKVKIRAARYAHRKQAYVEVHGGEVQAEGLEIRNKKEAQKK